MPPQILTPAPRRTLYVLLYRRPDADPAALDYANQRELRPLSLGQLALRLAASAAYFYTVIRLGRAAYHWAAGLVR
jgi:hypothetical protein